MNPCIPSSWPEYSLVWRFGRTGYEIVVKNPDRRCRGISEAELDGAAVDPLPYRSSMTAARITYGSCWETRNTPSRPRPTWARWLPIDLNCSPV